MRHGIPLLVCFFPLLAFGQTWDELSTQAGQAYHAGRYELALELTQRSIRQAEQEFGTRHANYFKSRGDLATILKKKGQYAEAQRLEQDNLLDIERALGKENLTYVTALKNAGNTYLDQAAYQPAEQYYLLATSAIGKIIAKKDEYYEANYIHVFDAYVSVQSQLAVIYERMGRFVEAENSYINLIGFSTSVLGSDVQTYPMYAVLLNNLANVYLENQLFKKAEPYLLESRALSEKQYGPTSAYVLQTTNNLATVYKNTDRPAEAEQALKVVIQGVEETQGPGTSDHIHALNNLAELCFQQERYPESERYLLQAMSWQEKNFGREHPMYQTLVHNLAETYQWMNRFQQADTLYQIAVDRVMRDVEKNFTYLTESEKRSFYLQNALFVSEYANFALLKSGALPLPGLPKEQLSKSSLGGLYNLQLNTKALLLNSTAKANRLLLASNDSLLIQRLAQWKQIKNEIARQFNLPTANRLNLDSLIQLTEFQESQLARVSSQFRKGFTSRSVTWQAVRQKLKRGEAAVELIRFYDGLIYVALIVTPETTEHPELAILKSTKTKNLEKEFLTFYKNAIQLKLTDTISYNRFWKPIYDTLKKSTRKIKRVYLSPDGLFNEINLLTLQNPKTGKFVIDEVDIELVTNTREIVERTNLRKKSTGRAVLVGRPDFGVSQPGQEKTRGSFADLPGTEREVNEIANSLRKKNWQTEVFTGKNAREEILKRVESPDVLHLATHGFFLPPTTEKNQRLHLEAMLQSGIILASPVGSGADEEDGILSGYESMNLNLDSTRLVVLSACETGLGTIEAGEGVYGLQRALKVAGAHAILMSLWKVDDTATQELMTLFYQRWIKSGSLRPAFRQAQLALRKKYNHPYYWGAFVLNGN